VSDFLRMLLVFFAAVNPAAVFLAVSPKLEGRGDRLTSLAAGAVVAGVVVAAAALGSGQVLDALDIEPETFRTSAGIVMAAVGVFAVWRAHNDYEIEPSWRGGVFPIGIPLLLGPATLVVALSYADDPGVGQTLVAGLVVVGATAAAVAWLPKIWGVALGAVARLSGALLVVFAVALIVSGVRDV
jgi:multiple antibiotic resistance protein